MEDNTKKILKKDIITIVQLCKKYDCSKPEIAKKIYSIAMEKSIFESSIGKSCLQRIASIANGEANEDLCLLCRKSRASNYLVCPECIQKISNLQDKQDMNSMKLNQTIIESGAVNKENASEIEKHTKEFTQNVGSTSQEILVNEENVIKEDRKMILDEINSESDQKIIHKEPKQAGEVSNGIRKAVTGENAKGDGVTLVPKENSHHEQRIDDSRSQTVKNRIEEKSKQKKGKGIFVKICLPILALFFIIFKSLSEDQSSNIDQNLVGDIDENQNIDISFTFTESEAVEWLNNRLGEMGWKLNTSEDGNSYYFITDENINGTLVDKTITDTFYHFETDDNGYVTQIQVLLSGNVLDASGNAVVLAMAGIQGCDGSISAELAREIYIKTLSDSKYTYNNLKFNYVYFDDSKSAFMISYLN